MVIREGNESLEIVAVDLVPTIKATGATRRSPIGSRILNGRRKRPRARVRHSFHRARTPGAIPAPPFVSQRIFRRFLSSLIVHPQSFIEGAPTVDFQGITGQENAVICSPCHA